MTIETHQTTEGFSLEFLRDHSGTFGDLHCLTIFLTEYFYISHLIAQLGLVVQRLLPPRGV